ncbi:uncharacterized protein LOC141651166 [Silene latifolia]|uniref:uncharacterized protein LOC141651166 n=1 Tax=Silene latifolia TaxID=37657 RepID=UPI003D775CE9
MVLLASALIAVAGHEVMLHSRRLARARGSIQTSDFSLSFFNSVNIRNSKTLATIEEIKLCNSYYNRLINNSIKGCVDGVLLANNEVNVIFLWNPTLRKIVDIPLDNSLKKTEDVTFGFGFDSVSNIYKVVALSFKKSGLKTMVYNLGSRSWTPPKVKSCSIKNVKYLSSTPRFVNFQGCVYWLAKAGITRNNKQTHYLCFNLSTEALTCSKVPDVKCVDGINYVSWRRLAVLHESLALVVDYSGDTNSHDRHIRVWIRPKDSTTSVFSWVELYNLDCGGKSFIYLTNSGNLYLQSWPLPKTLSVCDLKTGKEKVCSERYINFMDGYLESLALLR